MVARTPGGREVASSILVAPTIAEINVFLMYLTPVKRVFSRSAPRFCIFEEFFFDLLVAKALLRYAVLITVLNIKRTIMLQ